MARGTVLVVDDDPIVLEVARERLTSAGYKVVLREKALGTAEYIANHRPDFVLLDVMMPGLSGDRLAEVLRRHALTRQVSIILHSSKDSRDLEAIARRTGVLGAIEKTGDSRRFLKQFEALTARADTAEPA